MKFASDLPYPEITTRHNPQDAKLLMGVYCGSQGELSAITTYAYQAYITQKYPELAKVLSGIAATEMHHHKLLGCTIYALGGYPVMGARTYWNGSFARYTINPQRYLKENIIAEQNAITNYEHTILNLSTDDVKLLLERIILDEELHVRIFKELLQKYFPVQEN